MLWGKVKAMPKYHITWSTKYRQRVIGGQSEEIVERVVTEAVDELGGSVIEVECMPDHVHLFTDLPSEADVSKLLALAKGRSSRELRQAFPHLARLKALWAPGHFARVVPEEQTEVVARYVRDQKTAAHKQAG